MQRRSLTLVNLAAIASLALAPNFAAAASLAEQLVGTWTLTSNTESYADGSSYQWGPDAKGTLILTPNGQFSLQMGVGERKPLEGNPALNPVGRYVAYFGAYAVDESGKVLTFKIVRSAFPGWDGTEQGRVIKDIGDTMTYTTVKPIPSAKGPITPTVVWARMK